ncbi:MAG: hypothetical protein Q4C46_03500 [Bacillota bacterium]|nr:hypothetical protein [Bacillota bacterium]
MILILTIIFDLLLVFLPFNFAKHMVASTIITDLFGATPTMDKEPSQILFEGLLYFGAAVIIELTIVSHIEPLRCLAFSPSYYRDKKKREGLSAAARGREKAAIVIGFIVIAALILLTNMYI